jgi:tetratricopeptide (TPR) repeat protein
VLRRLGVPAAWVVAAAFALHPMQVESVAWITDRKNARSGAFFFPAFYAYLRFDDSRRLGWYATALAAFVFALLSKTVACVLPAVLVIALVARRRLRPAELLSMAPFWVWGLAAGLVTASVELGSVAAPGETWERTFWERSLLVAPRVHLFYLRNIVWPHPIIFTYPRWEPSAGEALSFLPLALSVALLGAAALLIRKCGPGMLALLLAAAALTFPALGFFSVYAHRSSWVADHFQYLGCAAFLAAVVLAVYGILRRIGLARPSVAVALAGVWLAALGTRTFLRIDTYRDARSLWEDTLRQYPAAWVAHLNLGNAAAARGEFEVAERHFQSVMKHPAAVVDGLGAWANAKMRAGDAQQAVALSRRALELAPDNAKLLSNHALMQLASRAEKGAAAAAERALDLDPGLSNGWYTLGVILAAQKRSEDAAAALRRAIELGLDRADLWKRYADVLAALGRREDSQAALERSRMLAPPTVSNRE